MNNNSNNCGDCGTTCSECGRPWAICKQDGGCGCNKCKDIKFCEYGRMANGCIREKQPGCPMQAVIPSVTVESIEGIKNLADCLVHVSDINTTFYIDDKHRPIVTWAGLISVSGYDVEGNPKNFRGQVVYDTMANILVVFDSQGVGHTFDVSETMIRSVVLPAAGWSNEAPYTQTVSLSGVTRFTDLSAPYLAYDATEAENEALSCISGGSTDAGSVTFYCYEEKPTTTITVYMVDKGTKLETSNSIATRSTLGVVRIGDGLNIDQAGKLSVDDNVYFDKDGTRELLNNKISENVTFLFNPQRDINESYDSLTTDSTPDSSKFYFVETDHPLATNGKTAVTRLTEFESGIRYYERASNINGISGECFIIKAFGKTIMIDTGGTNRAEPIKEYLQENGVTKVDYLIISHYHYDHCTNLASISEYVDFTGCKCYLPLEAPVEQSIDGQSTSALMSAINNLGLEVIYPTESSVLKIEDLTITFYNCGTDAFNEINEIYGEATRKVNDYSMLCLVNYLNTNVLYSGDIEITAQKRLHNKGFFKDKTIDLYKWHHHGVDVIEDCYKPFIEEVMPREFVVVANTIEHTASDEVYLNASKGNYAFEKTLKWISNGSVIKQVKENFPVFNLKNLTVFSNSEELNGYFGFLKIRNALVYKTPTVLLRISDYQNARISAIVEVKYHVNNAPSDIIKFRVRTLSETGSIFIQDMLYLVSDGDSVKFFLKKTSNYITPCVTVLDYSFTETATLLEPIKEKYSSSDFESAYPNAYNDPCVHELTLNSDYFAVSGGREGNKLTWYKKNGVVEIFGVLTTTAQVGTSGAVICELPEEILPRRASSGSVGFVQQSNSANRWFAQIERNSETGKYVLRFSRYGAGSNIACAAGAWLPVQITYLSND